jgi:hypothetical protein
MPVDNEFSGGYSKSGAFYETLPNTVYQSDSTGRYKNPSQPRLTKTSGNPAGSINPWLPATGERNNGTLAGVGFRGNFWSSSPVSSGVAYNLVFNSYTTNPAYTSGRAIGFSVRCVKE